MRFNLFFLSLFSLLLRALFFIAHVGCEENFRLAFDSAQYEKVAENIAMGNGIAIDKDTPNFYRLPGYPLFLAGCYKLFGHNSRRAMLFQLVLASFIPVLVFMLAGLLFSSVTVAQCAGLLAAVHPGFILYAGILSTESLFLLFFLLFLIFFMKPFMPPSAWLRTGSETRTGSERKNIVLSGICLGITSLIRPVGHYIIILAILLLLFRPEKIKKIGALCTGWLLVVFWWLLRNYLLTGAIFFHSLPGLHFLQYSAVHAEMGYVNFGDDNYFATKKAVFNVWEKRVAQEEKEKNRALKDYEKNKIAESLALDYVIKRPFITIKNSLINIIRTCCTFYSSILLYVPAGTVYEKGTSLWFKIKLYLFPRVTSLKLALFVYWELLYSLFLLLGLILFFYHMLCNKFLLGIFLKTAPFVMLFIFITLAYGCARLRFGCEPFFIIWAAAGWVLKKR